MSKQMDAIKAQFKANTQDGPSIEALQTAVDGLRQANPEMSLHDAAVQVTRWAVDLGLFDPSQEGEAEAEAEQVLAAGE